MFNQPFLSLNPTVFQDFKDVQATFLQCPFNDFLMIPNLDSIPSQGFLNPFWVFFKYFFNVVQRFFRCYIRFFNDKKIEF